MREQRGCLPGLDAVKAVALALSLCGATSTVLAQGPWEGQSFLSDYSRLQPVQAADGQDYAYLVAPDASLSGRYDSVMVDQPEVFFSLQSPHKGAKPEDLAAIAVPVRSSITAALQERGYRIAAAPGPTVLYARIAVTDLQVDRKKRNLLAYTPVGFVVSEGITALQDFTEKYDVLDLALQAEIRDSMDGTIIGAAVMQRGASAAEKKPIKFEALLDTSSEFGARFACRLDNSYVLPAERIDCSNAALRKSRPRVQHR